MRVAYVDAGRISEILHESFQTIESLDGYYPDYFIAKCEVVPDWAKVDMVKIDGVWQFPPVDPPHEVTLEEVVQRVEVAETDLDETKRGLLDISMRIV